MEPANPTDRGRRKFLIFFPPPSLYMGRKIVSASGTEERQEPNMTATANPLGWDVGVRPELTTLISDGVSIGGHRPQQGPVVLHQTRMDVGPVVPHAWLESLPRQQPGGRGKRIEDSNGLPFCPVGQMGQNRAFFRPFTLFPILMTNAVNAIRRMRPSRIPGKNRLSLPMTKSFLQTRGGPHFGLFR